MRKGSVLVPLPPEYGAIMEENTEETHRNNIEKTIAVNFIVSLSFCRFRQKNGIPTLMKR
jgi:translation initiation factor IF-2